MIERLFTQPQTDFTGYTLRGNGFQVKFDFPRKVKTLPEAQRTQGIESMT